jgi:hypothetical protein
VNASSVQARKIRTRGARSRRPGDLRNRLGCSMRARDVGWEAMMEDSASLATDAN